MNSNISGTAIVVGVVVGALVLARAVDDPAMSEEILRATSEAIVEAAR